MHQALECGLRLDDLHRLSVGQVLGIVAEISNDQVEWKQYATADDIAKHFG